MTEHTPKILNIGDEALDAPMQNALPGCGFGPNCVGVPCMIGDEALDASEQTAVGSCIPPCAVPCYVSDEALDAPMKHAILTTGCGIPCSGRPYCTVDSHISEEDPAGR